MLTAQHKLEALEAAQAQHAEHVQSLSGQVGQRLKVRPVLGQFAHQGSSKIPAIAQNMTPGVSGSLRVLTFRIMQI